MPRPGPRLSGRTVTAVAATAALLAGMGLAACTSSDDGDGAPTGFQSRDLPIPLPRNSGFGSDSDTTDGSTMTVETSATSEPAATSEPTETSGPATTEPTSTSTTTTTIDPATVLHAYPVDPAVSSSFTPQGHSNYRATDVFSSAGCGTPLRSPVTGVVDEVLPDVYDAAVDDPATRGGNAVAIVGDDGVRYYLAHFQVVDPAIVPGARVEAGQHLGEMGETGRAGACHVHFGLSLPCPEGDWWVRRGVIWPDEYLLSWKDGGNLSPLPELQAWFAEYPDACRSVDDTPYPVS